jgi:hypothetical protein
MAVCCLYGRLEGAENMNATCWETVHRGSVDRGFNAAILFYVTTTAFDVEM